MKEQGIKINTKITQIGSSLGVIIPTLVCKSMDIQKGSPIKAELQSDKIILTKEDNN